MKGTPGGEKHRASARGRETGMEKESTRGGKGGRASERERVRGNEEA